MKFNLFRKKRKPRTDGTYRTKYFIACVRFVRTEEVFLRSKGEFRVSYFRLDDKPVARGGYVMALPRHESRDLARALTMATRRADVLTWRKRFGLYKPVN